MRLLLRPIFLFSALVPYFTSFSQDTKASYAKWVGTYYNTLPCPDCEGIQYVIQLNIDRTFKEELVYVGKSASILTITGNYTTSPNGIMTLIKSNNGFKFFRKHPEGLRLLDTNAKIIAGEFADKYILKTAKHITTAKFIASKYLEMTDFYAFGNNDDWELDINTKGKMTFETDTDSITANLSKPDTSLDKKTINYIAKNDSVEFRINIEFDSCRNPTTGERFIYRTEVSSKKKTEPSFTQLTGGGRKLTDQRLDNHWVLKTLNSKKIKPKDFPNGVPSIRFNIFENKIKGFTGCNNFEGKASFEGNTWNCKTKPITELPCPKAKTEKELQRILNSKVLYFQIEGYLLKVFEGKKIVLEFLIEGK